MSRTKHISFIVFITLLITVITSCTFTTTMPKKPVFKTPADKMKEELNRVIKSEDITITGSEVKVNGVSTSTLQVDIINEENMPTNDTLVYQNGWSIAKYFKRNLKDPNEYDQYTVNFVKQAAANGLTNSQSHGVTLQSKQLRITEITNPNP